MGDVKRLRLTFLRRLSSLLVEAEEDDDDERAGLGVRAELEDDEEVRLFLAFLVRLRLRGMACDATPLLI